MSGSSKSNKISGITIESMSYQEKLSIRFIFVLIVRINGKEFPIPDFLRSRTHILLVYLKPSNKIKLIKQESYLSQLDLFRTKFSTIIQSF